MLTILALILLTVVYFAIGAGVACLIAKYYDMEPGGLLKNNNTWWFVGVGATVITFVIACFNFGPALLLPEKIPTPEQRGTVGDFLNHLLHGKNAPAKSVPAESLPWATGTWFWWKAVLWFFFITGFYTFFAFWDELSSACRGVANLIRERRRQKEEEERHHPPPGPGATPASGGSGPHPTGHSFGELLKVEFIVEIVTEFFKHFIRRRP